MRHHVTRRLFWDIDTATFEPSAQYTIERILELGDEIAVRWLWSLFTRETISAAVRNSRQLSPRGLETDQGVFPVAGAATFPGRAAQKVGHSPLGK